MSPILDLQRRLREVGRIRLGEQVANKSGNGTHPTKLDRFRFTSADKTAIMAVAGTYGGSPQPWEGAAVGEQFELYADSKELDVLVPPVDLAYSQWMEDWAGSVCRHRCDRQTDIKNDCPCTCDPDSPICKPTTRLGVILTAIDGIGIWRLETHGWAAAAELTGAIEVLRMVQNRGATVPARLLLEQRQQKKINDKGEFETFNFAVPVLDLNLSVAALTGGTATPKLTTGATPIQQSSDATVSIADQVAAVAEPVIKPPRTNAAAPIPATGIKPRTAAATTPSPTGEPLLTEPQGKMIARLFNKLEVKEREDRLSYLVDTFHHPFTSSKELTKKEASTLIEELMLAAGEEPKPRTNTRATKQDDGPIEPTYFDESGDPF